LPDVVAIDDLDGLPTADFSDFALDRYWVPTPVLPMPIARGCYWDKCTFCYYGFVPDGRRATAPYREHSLDRIVGDMVAQRDRHGCRHFDFSVDLVAPRLLDRLAGEIAGRGLDLRWGLETRAERYFTAERCAKLKAGGMTYAEFGLESMDQEVLDGIHKGTKVEQYAEVLANFHGAGIATGAMGFFDFPIEDAAAARRSLALLRRHSEHISEIAWGSFVLDIGSQVHRDPARFGIREVAAQDEDDLALSVNFVPESVRKTDAERAAIEEELRHLIEDVGYASELTRPFVGGGTGEAHTFLLYSRLGPDAAKAFGRHARRRKQPGMIDREQIARRVIGSVALRYPVEELCARYDELIAALSDRKGEPVVQLGRRPSRGQRLATWDAAHAVQPGSGDQIVMALPGRVAIVGADVAALLELCTGDRPVAEILASFPEVADQVHAVLSQARSLGWLEVVGPAPAEKLAS
jgi:hypothetical protein